MTPRELLVIAAGERGKEHELHSPVGKARSRQAITLTCSCGEVFALPNTPEHLHVLRNLDF